MLSQAAGPEDEGQDDCEGCVFRTFNKYYELPRRDECGSRIDSSRDDGAATPSTGVISPTGAAPSQAGGAASSDQAAALAAARDVLPLIWARMRSVLIMWRTIWMRCDRS